VEKPDVLLSIRMTCGEDPARGLCQAIQPAGLGAGSEHPARSLSPTTKEISLGIAMVPLP